MIMPGGSSMPYHDGTVDIYEDMEAMMTDSVEAYFRRKLGDMADKLFDETNENTDLMRREVRIRINGLD